MEGISDGLVKCLFLSNGSTDVERQLNKDAILSAPDTKIVFVGYEGVSRILGDNLKTVIFGRLQNIDHRFIDDAPIARRYSADFPWTRSMRTSGIYGPSVIGFL
jgi:hypothetical protein